LNPGLHCANLGFNGLEPGLFTGCSLALLVSFFFLVENPMSFDHGGGNEYLDTVFPVFRLVLFSGQSQLISHFSAL
jgi:hypothetical protein